MDLPSLHKKLLPNWSAGTVSKLLSSTSNLDVVKNGFNKLEKKTQMRVLLSLLNFDSRSRSDQLGSIQSLLEYASEDKNGKWLPVIAGLVHARIIGNKEISDSDVESTAFYQLEETADKIIKQLIDEDQKNLTQNSLNFQPLELKYLTLSNNGDISKQSKDTNDLNVKTEHFMYFGGKPDLITLASKGLEEKHLNDMKNKNVPAIGRNREVYGVKNSSSSGSSSSSSSNNDRRVKTAHIENDHEESTQISSEDVFVYPLECYMTTQLFKDMILNPHSDDAVPYLSLQNDNLRVDMAELMEDIQPSLEIADEAFGMQQPEAVNLWIGDERSVSSLHKDHFENMYAVISGEKTFTLLPPTDIMYLDEREYPTRKYQLRNKKHPDSVDSDQIVLHDRLKHENLELYESENPSEKIPWISTDPEDPLILIKNPKFKYAHPLRCRVQEGEILYIPAMWFHRVSQTRLTIAVNYWYDQKFDFRYVFYQSVKRFKHEKLGITDDDDDV
mmetsp:Transcript_7864/g.7927  ORF Transcript_7864/g.7927 Transcript_7864/m.7927 type:complete len:501 (-) Transcript_7864:10-1512(-)